MSGNNKTNGINKGRRRAIKSLGAFGVSTKIVPETVSAERPTVDAAEVSDFFQKKINQHGKIVDSEIKGLGNKSNGPSPDWRIKYTFEDGSKFPTFYNLTSDILEVRIASERFAIDREAYEQKLAEKREKIQEVEMNLDKDMEKKATEFKKGGD